MRQVQSRWAQGRRIPILCALVAAGLMAAPLSSAYAQDPAPSAAPAQQAPAAQPAQPAPPPGITFDADSGILIMYVKADKAAGFETAMAKVQEALTKSEKPERKQQATGWKVFKAAEPGPNGSVMYVSVVTPTLKGADYSIIKVIAETFPTEARKIFDDYIKDAFTSGTTRLNLTLVKDLGAPAQ